MLNSVKQDLFSNQDISQDPPQDQNLSLSEPIFEDLKDLQCVHPEHQKPVQIVILDVNLQQKERFLCEICLRDQDLNKKSIGIQRAFIQTLQHYQQKKELREVVLMKNINQLEQLINNFISLKTIVNQNMDEMIEASRNWIKNLKSIKSQQFQFYDEIECLIHSKQNMEIEQIAQEIKTLNKSWIPKFQKKLKFFSSFSPYPDCKNILNNLTEDIKNLGNQVGPKKQEQQRVGIEQISQNKVKNSYEIPKDIVGPPLLPKSQTCYVPTYINNPTEKPTYYHNQKPQNYEQKPYVYYQQYEQKPQVQPQKIPQNPTVQSLGYPQNPQVQSLGYPPSKPQDYNNLQYSTKPNKYWCEKLI